MKDKALNGIIDKMAADKGKKKPGKLLRRMLRRVLKESIKRGHKSEQK